MKTIDCRGQACPAPVIATKKALEETRTAVCVLLDDGAPYENVTRFARNRGCQVTETRSGDGWSVVLAPAADPATAADAPATLPAAAAGDRVLLISSVRLGDGPEALGTLLMKNFLITLLETSQRPARILLLNTGVLLAVEGAETVEPLRKLEELGVEIYACGICLDFLQHKDKLAVGKVTNMFSTAEQLLNAASVIKL